MWRLTASPNMALPAATTETHLASCRCIILACLQDALQAHRAHCGQCPPSPPKKKKKCFVFYPVTMFMHAHVDAHVDAHDDEDDDILYIVHIAFSEVL